MKTIPKIYMVGDPCEHTDQDDCDCEVVRFFYSEKALANYIKIYKEAVVYLYELSNCLKVNPEITLKWHDLLEKKKKYKEK